MISCAHKLNPWFLVAMPTLDPQAGWHPAAGGPAGPPYDGCAPRRLRGPEEPGLWQSQRRQQDRPEELRRHPGPGATPAQDHRCGDQGAAHR